MEAAEGSSYSHVLQDRPAKPIDKPGTSKEQHVADDSAVITAGDSNMERSSAAIVERVKGDKRVKVGCFPGQTMQTVMTAAKGQLALSSKARNPVVTAAGLNNVLKGEEGKLGQEIAKGVKDLRATAPSAVCNAGGDEAGVHTERAVLAANSEIVRRGRELGLEQGSGQQWTWASGTGFTSGPG